MPKTNELSRDELFAVLDAWTRQGRIRELERSFVRFLEQMQPDAPPVALLIAALVSHQLGRGHICLDLPALLDDPHPFLDWPQPASPAAKEDVAPADILSRFAHQSILGQLETSKLVDPGAGNRPLVLSQRRLYLRRHWQYEQQMAAKIRYKMGLHFTSPDLLEDRIDRYFHALRNAAEKSKTEVHWQSIAAALAIRSGFCIISGGPGTGKTTTVFALMALLQETALEDRRPLRVGLAAPTGKAAARLTQSIAEAKQNLPDDLGRHLPDQAVTLHRLLGSRKNTRRFVHDARNRLPVDLLLIDEASMVDLEMMAALLDALADGARLILLGDKDQLASVEAGAVLGDLCRHAEKARYGAPLIDWVQQHTGYRLTDNGLPESDLEKHTVVLRTNHRFGANSGIGALARAVNRGRPQAVDDIWRQSFADIHRLQVGSTQDKAFARLVLDGQASADRTQKDAEKGPSGYRHYLQLVRKGRAAYPSEKKWLHAVLDAFGDFQLIAAVREGDWGVKELNRVVERILYQSGCIPAKGGWYPGRPVMVTRNDYRLGLMNGDIGICLPLTDEKEEPRLRQRVIFAMTDGTLKKVHPSQLNAVETAYAMTVHKSQGSEFRHAAMVLPDRMAAVLTRELVYTAITRARSWFTLVGAHLDLLGAAVRLQTRRFSGLADCFNK